MTQRQTLPDLLARITTDLAEAQLNAASRSVREERERADRYRDEAQAYRDIVEDVVESLELLAPVPDGPQPDSIPIQALWDALDLPAYEPPTAARVWEVLAPILEARGESIPVAELAEMLGCDADATSVRMRLEDITSDEGAEPDAEGWHTHDGESFPHCGLDELVEVKYSSREKENHRALAGRIEWAHRGRGVPGITHWRYADGRDIEHGGAA